MSQKLIRFLRFVSLLFGCALILVSLTADLTGLSVGSGFSRNQWLILCMGLFAIIGGILGAAFAKLYRRTAIMLLNLLILLVVLDISALVVVKLIDADRFRLRQRKLDAGGVHLLHDNVVERYVPFVLWRAVPDTVMAGATTDGEGFRITPPSTVRSDGDTLYLYAFGGSAMWGYGVDDTCTIAFYLQQELASGLERPVRVSNRAQCAQASTQELIELLLQLRAGNVPDIVLFYDGFNDVASAYESGIAGAHLGLRSIEGRIEGDPRAMGRIPLAEDVFRRTNFFLFLGSIGLVSSEANPLPPESYMDHGVSLDSLADDVVSIYLGNTTVATKLSEAYGFAVYFVLQPNIWCGSKPLSACELGFRNGSAAGAFQPGEDENWRNLIRRCYLVWADSISNQGRIFDYSDAFDTCEYPVYTDGCGAHITAAGNRMIAARLADDIMPEDSLEYSENSSPSD